MHAVLIVVIDVKPTLLKKSRRGNYLMHYRGENIPATYILYITASFAI